MQRRSHRARQSGTHQRREGAGKKGKKGLWGATGRSGATSTSMNSRVRRISILSCSGTRVPSRNTASGRRHILAPDPGGCPAAAGRLLPPPSRGDPPTATGAGAQHDAGQNQVGAAGAALDSGGGRAKREGGAASRGLLQIQMAPRLSFYDLASEGGVTWYQ